MVLCFYTILAKLSLSVVPNKSLDTDINVFDHRTTTKLLFIFSGNRLVGCRWLCAR